MNDYDNDPRERHLADDPVRTAVVETTRQAEVSQLARQADPSLSTQDTPEGQAKEVVEAEAKKRAGVQGDRPTDLLAAKAANWSGRGIDLGAKVNHQVRAPLARAGRATGRGVHQAATGLSERAKQLPPLSAFGRRGGGPEMTPVSRRGIARASSR
jgi:hypothetical protein